MLLGLVLKTVEDAQAYRGFLALLLITVNCSVALYTLKLIVTSLCGNRCVRKKANKTVVAPSDKIAERVKHFLAEMRHRQKDLFYMMSEAQICSFLKMSQNERDAYATHGEMQKSVIGHFCTIEKEMAKIESKERETGKTSRVLRLLSSSGEKVEELKRLRKEYGAQSEEYKNAVIRIEK